jgi:hypothetical protein
MRDKARKYEIRILSTIQILDYINKLGYVIHVPIQSNTMWYYFTLNWSGIINLSKISNPTEFEKDHTMIIHV